MAKAVCQAVAEHGRIQLIIRKNQNGYAAFSKILSQIEEHGFISWYGDVTTPEGKEASGLIITAPPATGAETPATIGETRTRITQA
jgi:hypothetical protein